MASLNGDQGDYPYFGYFKKNFEYWKDFVTPEPISSDLREKVRLDVQKQWYSERLNQFRMCIWTNWTRVVSVGKIHLDSELGDIDSLHEARLFCNRPSGCYWSQDLNFPTTLFATIFGECVIIARTGKEEQLSAPVSFESLHSKALPLERVDFDGEAKIDVIRVPLSDAVRFVIDLEKREDAVTHEGIAAPRIDRALDGECREVFTSDESFCGDPYEWADQHIIAAEKHGYQHCEYTAEALRRVQAELKNEIYLVLSPLWFAPKLIDYEGELGPQI
ncbi:MAG: hypothetical protein Q9167_006205 [Letrouitia subvulpina]